MDRSSKPEAPQMSLFPFREMAGVRGRLKAKE